MSCAKSQTDTECLTASVPSSSSDTFEIRLPSWGELALLADTLRGDDRREIEVTGLAPLQSIRIALDVSLWVKAAFLDGAIACAWGLAANSIFSDTAYPWLLTTKLVDARRTAFAREALVERDAMLAAFPRLEGYVIADYRRCIRWLRWMGFRVDAPAPLGRIAEPFRRFQLETA